MTNLNALKNKDPKEVARLLSMVSNSLLPNPGISDVINQTSIDPEFVKAILSEIRDRLRLPEGDYSAKTQSRVYAFLSEEISKAALANVDMSKLKARLGNKGELHPSQYQVSFPNEFVILEALGIRRPHIIEAITQPNQITNLRGKYRSDDPRLTISIKSVTSKRVEDSFILFVVSERLGQVQSVMAAFRAYKSDVDLKNVNEPLDVVKAFTNIYGLTFRVGGVVSKFMCNEIIRGDKRRLDKTVQELDDLEPLEGQMGAYYLPFIIQGPTKFRGADAEVLSEVFLAFVVDVPKYVATLRKHHVQLTPEPEWRFPRIRG